MDLNILVELWNSFREGWISNSWQKTNDHFVVWYYVWFKYLNNFRAHANRYPNFGKRVSKVLWK